MKHLRIKALDRYFLLLLVSFLGLVWGGTFMIERRIARSALQSSTEQHLQSARILTKTVERDLLGGEIRDAWKQLNRGIDRQSLIGFLLVDGAGELMIKDPDTKETYDRIRAKNHWERTAGIEGRLFEISQANDFMIVTEEIQQMGQHRGSAKIIYLFNLQRVVESLSLIRFSFFALLIGLCLVTIPVFFVLRRAFKSSLVSISEGVQQVLRNEEPTNAARSLMADYFPSIPFLKRFSQEFQETKQNLQEQLKLTLVGEIASQVAHDIRSPLAALDSVVNRMGQLPEQDRVFMRSAINRIKDIANDLLQKNQEMVAASNVSGVNAARAATKGGGGETLSTQLLSSLLDPLITEKRLQFRSKIGIEIDGRIDARSYGLFAKIKATEFKRVVSNLINNAVEVLGEKGSVVLSLSGQDNQIEITVRDNGKGIAPEVLAKLGQRGETHGKAGGSGLGLYHARTSVELWGGAFRIESEVGKGTSVIMTLPQAPAPQWFVSTLSLLPGTSVVILDDDSSIHQIWQGRMDSLRVSEKQITVVHVSTPEQLRTWIQQNSAAAKQALYLADYELLGFQETGLMLIEELNLGPQSVLVTSRFEERQIMEGCKKLKVRLIPKGLAGFVPISFGVALESVDAILIDDDDLVHLTWKSAAKYAGKSIRVFLHPDQFFAVADTFGKSSPVYVDANLGQGIKGEDVAERIHKIGFTRVFLATGYEPEKYKQYKFLEAVLGKDPPF